MNFRQIEAFRAVMITGTTTEAATLLHLSQPAVSRLIGQLQSSTRIKLFELRKGRLVPTPEAKALFLSVERSFVGLDKIRQAVANLRSVGSGRITIGSLPSLGLSVLPQAIGRFLKAHPGVSVALQTVGSNPVKEGVAAGQFDLGFAAEEIDTTGVEALPLLATEAVCVMCAGHALAGRKLIRPRDLQGVPLVALDHEDMLQLRINRLLAAHGVTARPAVETTYAATICALALQGLGVGLVNPLIAADFVERGLVIRRFAPAIRIQILLLFPPHAPPSQLARRFVGTLRACLEGYPGVRLSALGRV